MFAGDVDRGIAGGRAVKRKHPRWKMAPKAETVRVGGHAESNRVDAGF